MERLKERILDGHLLGWRTLHIQLGPAEDLREAFLAFLGGPEGALIARYAQAPHPHGRNPGVDPLPRTSIPSHPLRKEAP